MYGRPYKTPAPHLRGLAYKALAACPWYWTDDQDEYAKQAFAVRLSARDRKRALAHKREFIALLQDHGVMPYGGCDCGSCQNGWDCCGRMFLQFATLVPIRRGIRVQMSFARNI
jgi:hypothetical protein